MTRAGRDGVRDGERVLSKASGHESKRLTAARGCPGLERR